MMNSSRNREVASMEKFNDGEDNFKEIKLEKDFLLEQK